MGISGKKKINFFVECPYCKNTFRIAPSVFKERKSGRMFCSLLCKTRGMRAGLVSWCFKKRKFKSGNNPYIRKMRNGIRKTEHRIIMEQYLGRNLLKNEHVHHINGNQKDNRIENLKVLSASEHARIHTKTDYFPLSE
jgi:hypothetical protein